MQRDPPAHRVAGERVRAVGERAQVGVAGGERGRPARGEVAVAGEVGRERPVASRERVADRLPAPARLGEAVEQDEVGGHRAGTMTATDTYLNLRAFVDELVRCGVREACTSPGSRSTPLVLSLVRDERLRSTSHVDERCGGFFALGLAKATGRPVALACTSGTAAANYAPAVIEAHEARVPLLVLTADRPPELRDVGAGQTIDQVKLYGSAAKWFLEVDDQPATPGARALAAPARLPRVLDRAGGPARPGAPELLAARAARARRAAAGGRAGRRRAGRRAAVGHAPAPGRRPGARRAGRAGGRAGAAPARARSSPGGPSATRGSARRWPRSPSAPACRCSPSRRPARAAARPRSRTTTRCCATPPSAPRARPSSCCASATCRPPSRCASGSPGSDERDAADRLRPRGRLAGPGRRGRRRCSPPTRARALDALAERLPRKPRAGGWLEAWTGPRPRRRRRDRRGARRPRRRCTEPRVAAELGVRLPADATLVVASSMPIRDVETFFPARADAAARALQPRRERDRRHGLDRVRRRGRRARPGRAADRRRRARCTTSAACSPRAGSGCR